MLISNTAYNGKGQLWLHQYSRIIIDVHKCSLSISFISISFPLMFYLDFPKHDVMHLMTPPTPLVMPGHGKGNPPSPTPA